MLREAARVGGEGIMQAMPEARPGMFEYELQAAADYVFRKHGAYGPAFFGLVATGQNTVYSHYHRGTARLTDGDWVQMDYGPDYKYYVTDITRVFPASGKFSSFQREFYTVFLRLYQSVLGSVRPRVPARDVIRDAVVKMDQVLASFTFKNAKIKQAATAFVERYRAQAGSQRAGLGHTIGMEVHDVGSAPVLEPGEVLTIEPAMSIPEDRVSMRLEDSFVITENGCEILTGFVPIEPDAIEKLMAESRQPMRSGTRR